MQRSFSLEYWIDDGWFVGRLKEIPGVFSQGETLEELEENIQDSYMFITSDVFLEELEENDRDAYLAKTSYVVEDVPEGVQSKVIEIEV